MLECAFMMMARDEKDGWLTHFSEQWLPCWLNVLQRALNHPVLIFKYAQLVPKLFLDAGGRNDLHDALFLTLTHLIRREAVRLRKFELRHAYVDCRILTARLLHLRGKVAESLDVYKEVMAIKKPNAMLYIALHAHYQLENKAADKNMILAAVRYTLPKEVVCVLASAGPLNCRTLALYQALLDKPEKLNLPQLSAVIQKAIQRKVSWDHLTRNHTFRTFIRIVMYMYEQQNIGVALEVLGEMKKHCNILWQAKWTYLMVDISQKILQQDSLQDSLSVEVEMLDFVANCDSYVTFLKMLYVMLQSHGFKLCAAEVLTRLLAARDTAAWQTRVLGFVKHVADQLIGGHLYKNACAAYCDILHHLSSTSGVAIDDIIGDPCYVSADIKGKAEIVKEKVEVDQQFLLSSDSLR